MTNATRFLLESIRPEIRQYFIESDSESVPFSRAHRSVVYARAKGTADTLPFGTRRDLYKVIKHCKRGGGALEGVGRDPYLDEKQDVLVFCYRKRRASGLWTGRSRLGGDTW